MTGHWLAELLFQIGCCTLGAIGMIYFAFKVGLFDYTPPPDPWSEARKKHQQF